MWITVFDNGYWHMVPTDEDGEVSSEHIPYPECRCHPEMEIYYDEENEEITNVILIHNQIQ